MFGLMNEGVDLKNLNSETPYRFTVEDYGKLVEAGILESKDRVELLEGELIIMAAIGWKHVISVRRLLNLFTRWLGDRCVVDCQSPCILDDFSEPLPDLLLLPAEAMKAVALPAPADILVAVEVAETSLGYDRGRKLQTDARAGIREYWVVNLIDQTIEIHQEPQAKGYRIRSEVNGATRPEVGAGNAPLAGRARAAQADASRGGARGERRWPWKARIAGRSGSLASASGAARAPRRPARAASALGC